MIEGHSLLLPGMSLKLLNSYTIGYELRKWFIFNITRKDTILEFGSGESTIF